MKFSENVNLKKKRSSLALVIQNLHGFLNASEVSLTLMPFYFKIQSQDVLGKGFYFHFKRFLLFPDCVTAVVVCFVFVRVLGRAPLVHS